MGMGMFEGYGDSLGAWGEVAGTYLGSQARERERLKALKYLQMMEGDIDAYEGAVPDEGVVELSPSAMGGVQADAGLKNNQLAALRRLGAMSEEGYTDQDRAAVANLMSDVNAQERGSRMAIESKLQPGSGAALAAKLGNQQASAQRANLGGLNLAANSRAQALRALSQYGGMATEMRGQDFGEQTERARAADAVNRFNATNAQGVMGRNVDRRQHVADTALAAKTGQKSRMAGFHGDTGDNYEDDWKRGTKAHRDAGRSGGAGGDKTMGGFGSGIAGGRR